MTLHPPAEADANANADADNAPPPEPQSLPLSASAGTAPRSATGANRRLLFLAGEDWYFWTQWRHLARAARAAGYEVAVATRVKAHGARIAAEGVRVYALQAFHRSSLDPVDNVRGLRELLRVHAEFLPAIVHHIALKPVIVGSLAAAIAGRAAVVNTLPGLGYVFRAQTAKARLLRPLAAAALRAAIARPHSHLIVQNDDDLATLQRLRIGSAVHTSVIRGVGVDIARFTPRAEPPGTPIVLLVGRMLWDKGVGEFVAAARLLRAQRATARFVLVGEPDPGNPRSIGEAQLHAWQRDGIVEWWGARDDMPDVLAASAIFCLPSHHEGLSTVLQEAAACARPIVATNIPGCREIARPGENGLLVPLRDATALAVAIGQLLADAPLRQRLGAAGRRLVEAEFTDTRASAQTLAVYRALEQRADRVNDLRSVRPA